MDTLRGGKESLKNFRVLLWLLIAIGLYISSLYSYLLFHSLAELFSVSIAFSIFILAWNSRRFFQNRFLQLIAVGYFFSGIIDLIHTLAYKGINIFEGYGTNLPTQLWISARSIQAITLFVSASLPYEKNVQKEISYNKLFLFYSGVVSLLLWSIFSGLFPDCFVEGAGLTTFKKVSEYGISLLVLIAILQLYRKKEQFESHIFRLIILSFASLIGSEMAFTLYKDAFGLFNLLGHYIKILSYYFIYRAIVVKGLMEPYDLLFRDLNKYKDHLETLVAEKTSRLKEELLERIRVEKSLRESEERFRAITTAATDAIIQINEKGKMLYWNPSAEKMFGYSAEEAIGKDLQSLLVPSQLYDDYLMSFDQFRRSGKGSILGRCMEFVAKRKDGTEFPVEVSLSGIRLRNECVAVWIVRDITERKEAERRMHDTNRLLKMFTQNITRKMFLDETVRLIKSHCGCHHAAIRVMDNKGNIPFESYDGYSDDFISCESPLSIHNDQCVCIRAITSLYDPQDADVLTPNGSFYYHNFVDYLSRLGEEGRGRYRGGCSLHGFRSIAVIPMRYQDRTVGLIHLADEKEGLFSKEVIEFIETLSYIIGEAITKFEIREESARLASAADSAADAIVITDHKGIIQYANPAFEQITGYKKEEVIGRNIHMLDSEKQSEDLYIQMREVLKRDGVWKGVLINRKKDGTIYHEECTISTVKDSSGEIRNYVAIKRDITEKLRLESIAETVNTMNNIGYIFSGVRHEIGNPVNSVKMTLSMLKDNLERFDVATIQRYLERSMEEIRRIEYLLRALKNFNMYERMKPEEIEIRSFMDKFIAIINDDFSKRNISLSLQISPDVDYCYADPRALHQVLLNILINACDAFDGKKDPNISISVSDASGMINIRVQDNGCGMTKEQLKNLFRPFYTTKPDGTGLGLVITKRMLTLMNGIIEIDSIKDKGTTVDILLPRRANGQ